MYIFKIFLTLMRVVLVTYKLFFNLWIDGVRYLKQSRTLRHDTPEKLRSAIVAHYHVLEKGLAMPDRKFTFGRDIAANLVKLLTIWEQKHYPADVQIVSAYRVLSIYADAVGFDVVNTIPGLDVCIKVNQKAMCANGGVHSVLKRDILELGKGKFSELIKARRSIRNYTNREVEDYYIKEAVRLAQFSPSVCNRQCGRVFWTKDRDRIKKVLELQNGNRGFGHLAGALLIVTSDLNVFEGISERNQSYIDGGLFSMSILYALSYLGLGACPLNWCVDNHKDRVLRKLIALPDSHIVVMMISVGHLPDSFMIAASQKNELSKVLCYIE